MGYSSLWINIVCVWSVDYYNLCSNNGGIVKWESEKQWHIREIEARNSERGNEEYQKDGVRNMRSKKKKV